MTILLTLHTPEGVGFEVTKMPDIFVASVINQKVVNQNAQQILVLIAAQVLNILEAQFGFATNLDNDNICA